MTSDPIRLVPTAIEIIDKFALYTRLKKHNAEGIVLKDLHAAMSSGRPASQGSQLKFKFVETASFIVLTVNAKRSVGLGLIDEAGKRVPAGNVTIPPNMGIPAVSTVVETRYLYAHKQSGSIYQPVYPGERDDIDPTECVVSQLKFRAEQASDEAA